MDRIMVSVICNSYNQEDYIEQTIHSLVNQKTSFRYEILVHDDASTDKTADIITKFASKYHELIIPMFQSVNQYSKGKDINCDFQFNRVRGRYIAFCEGDDYWTDRYKLQKQVDVLEKMPEVDICAHAANAIKADSGTVLYRIAPFAKNTLIKPEDVINGGGGYVATNSIMIRSDIIANCPSWYNILPMDYSLQILGALRGGMIFLTDNMSAYRIMAKNSWSRRMHENSNMRLCVNRKIIDMLNALDESTQHKYHDVIENKCEETLFWELYYNKKFKQMKRQPYRTKYKSLSVKNKALINLNIYAPWILKILRKFIC